MSEKMDKKALKKKKKKKSMVMKSVVLILLLVVLAVCIFFLAKTLKKDQAQGSTQKPDTEQSQDGADATDDTETGDDASSDAQDTAAPATDAKTTAREQAEYLAATYDYDGAIETLNGVEGAADDPEITAKIAEYQATKDSCVPVNMDEVTHIFYHSLIVDPDRGFAGDDSIAAGFKQWMTTVDEFNKITQAMYDNGYVLVRLRDLVVETTDADGTVHFTPNTELKLPAGKKAFVMSLDDLSYYHSYDGRGIASKIVLDENGNARQQFLKFYYNMTPRCLTVPTGASATDRAQILPSFVTSVTDASDKAALSTEMQGYRFITIDELLQYPLS